MKRLKSYPITSFFVIAYAVDWCIRIGMNIAGLDITPLKLLGEYGPLIAAVSVTGALVGKKGIWTLLGRLGKWRVHPIWYVFVLLGPAVLQLVGIGVFALIQGPRIVHFQVSAATPFLLLIGIVLSIGEETGWRGFAQPQMQTRYPIVISALIIGVLWECWHIPNGIGSLSQFANPFVYQAFLLDLILIIPASILMAWIYQQTGGSLLLIVLFHLGLGVLGAFVSLPTYPSGQFGPFDLGSVLLGIVAVLVVILVPGMRKRATGEQVPAPAAVGLERTS